MRLTFTPTKLAGGVKIGGDVKTLRKVERLLTRTALDAYNCYNNGLCMELSRYFEKNGETVDWVTLVAGISALRKALGYQLSRENHALICLLEYLTFEALTKVLNESEEEINTMLDRLQDSVCDPITRKLAEKSMVYLYLLQTSERRKSQLFLILDNLGFWGKTLYKDFNTELEGLNRDMLNHSIHETFQYEL